MTRPAALAVCLLIAAAYPATTAQSQEAWTDSSPHRSYFIYARGAQLSCLDWGGQGPPLLLVHGLGDSPHIFDDLANRLHDRYHVIAYARRGHGKSSAPMAAYDDLTLVEDLRQVMDDVRFPRASLLGWGMGGDEITAFAGRYPDRVDKIVYLEGGYDWSSTSFHRAFTKILTANEASTSTARSLDLLRVWYREALLGSAPWTNGLESNFRDMVVFDRSGAPHPGPAPVALAPLVATLGTWRREYKKVRAPVLALYATTYFPTERSDPALAQQVRDFEQNTMVPFRRASMERVQRELPKVTVRQIPNRTHMSIGIQDPDSLAAIIAEFLGSPP